MKRRRPERLTNYPGHLFFPTKFHYWPRVALLLNKTGFVLYIGSTGRRMSGQEEGGWRERREGQFSCSGRMEVYVEVLPWGKPLPYMGMFAFFSPVVPIRSREQHACC